MSGVVEKINDRAIFSLSEVAKSIQKTMSERYTSSFWVKAEMNKLNHYPQSGHCYPELVEKSDGKIVAEIRSTIWRDDFQRINASFIEVLHEPLKNGINILFCAKITYHPVHGLSLTILDIDPSFSLGELEKEKQQTIEKIRQEGIFNANKSLKLALLPKRIAIISVETSKGYADFRKVIDNNSWGYHFFYMLFPSLLQGEHAVDSIIGQLGRIKSVKHHFDAVAIIRGGGGDVGLTCYNNYKLSREIALFPIPVITGIGHSTNETVAELIAFNNAITPTELADFLIQKFHNFSVPVQRAQESVTDKFFSRVKDEKLRMLNVVRSFKKDVSAFIGHATQKVNQNVFRVETGSERVFISKYERLTAVRVNIASAAERFVTGASGSLAAMEKNVEILNPVNVLNRGYTITLFEGKALKSAETVRKGDTLTTILPDGEISSEVTTIHKTDKP